MKRLSTIFSVLLAIGVSSDLSDAQDSNNAIKHHTYEFAQLTAPSNAPWGSMSVIAYLEGIKIVVSNGTSSIFANMDIKVNAGGMRADRTGRILPPGVLIEIMVPTITQWLSACIVGLNRQNGMWIRVTGKFEAPPDNLNMRLRNMEAVIYEMVDYNVEQFSQRQSCD